MKKEKINLIFENQAENISVDNSGMKKLFTKKKILKITAITVVALLFVATAAFAAYQAFYASVFNREYEKYRGLYNEQVDINKLLNESKIQLETDLEDLKNGNALLEKQKKELEDEVSALDTRVADAEKQIENIKKELTDAEANLTKAKSELKNINDDLFDKKQELAKANRGVAKFVTAEQLYFDFKTKSDTYISHFNQSIIEINKYMEWKNETYFKNANNHLESAKKILKEMDEINKKMNDIFDLIKSGNY